MSEVVSNFARESMTSVAKRNLFMVLSFVSINIFRLSASVRVQTAVKHMANLSASREVQSKGSDHPGASESNKLRSDGK